MIVKTRLQQGILYYEHMLGSQRVRCQSQYQRNRHNKSFNDSSVHTLFIKNTSNVYWVNISVVLLMSNVKERIARD